MPTAPDGTPVRARRGAAVLRGLVVLLAVALGGVAAWLIVTGKTQKRIEIGVLIGLWGGLIAAYSMFTRHRGPVPATDPSAGAGGVLVRAEDAEARRHYEDRLEQMLRREIQAGLTAELQSLRSEVASLRSELVEKVGGQIQLERIEITRVIGSDIEALQQEVRQLKTGRSHAVTEILPAVALANESIDPANWPSSSAPRPQVVRSPPLPAAPPSRDPEPGVVRPISAGPTSATVRPVASAPSAPASNVPQTAPPASPAPTRPAPEPVRAAAPTPPPAARPPAPTPAAPTPAVPSPTVTPPTMTPLTTPAMTESSDPFAGLPRLSRFSDDDLPLVEPSPEAGGSRRPRADGGSGSTPANGGLPAAPPVPPAGYEASGRPVSGRHSASDAPRPGGRRRRPPGEADDLLSRVRERENR
jgi:hypothetical protein